MAETNMNSGESNTEFLSNLIMEMTMEKEKSINDLSPDILTRIVSFIPLRDRMVLSHVSKDLRAAVKSSITSLNFYRDMLDCLPDEQIKDMLAQYGGQIKSLNFDLFKSTFCDETSQWMWRQSVLTFVGLCPNLTELSILICNRHRLRDTDLVTIFEKCPQLSKICVDAQFLNGHCFKKAPVTLNHIEMEMCYRISDQSLRTMFSRFRKMRVLHCSQLLILSDQHIATMVRSFRQLQVLSIVSHVDTKYENLSGSGLAELGKLQKLRELCLEGLGAVTDRTLTMISDPLISQAANSIRSLSLAFCFNVSQHGLKHLGRMRSLINLNMDGITKRDVSMGLEKIAAEGRLVRLFIAERTNLSPESLISMIESSPSLRLLDLSNNEECFNWVTADKIMSLWSKPSSTRAPLTILTDEHLAWNIVTPPEPDALGRPRVLVVHINRAAVPSQELLPTNALSNVEPHCLPAGLLAPHIRRGNRYRLLWAPLGPSKEIKIELFDDKENGTSLADLIQQAESLQQQQQEVEQLNTAAEESMEEADDVLGAQDARALDARAQREWETEQRLIEWQFNEAIKDDENTAPSSLIDSVSSTTAPPMHPGPADFSFSPISPEDDPHTKDWCKWSDPRTALFGTGTVGPLGTLNHAQFSLGSLTDGPAYPAGTQTLARSDPLATSLFSSVYSSPFETALPAPSTTTTTASAWGTGQWPWAF